MSLKANIMSYRTYVRYLNSVFIVLSHKVGDDKTYWGNCYIVAFVYFKGKQNAKLRF